MAKNKKSLKEQKNDVILAVTVAALAGTAAWMSARIEKIRKDTAVKKAAMAAAAEQGDFAEEELDQWILDSEKEEDGTDGL